LSLASYGNESGGGRLVNAFSPIEVVDRLRRPFASTTTTTTTVLVEVIFLVFGHIVAPLFFVVIVAGR
jgi:hypothetical protein